ncbi:hypothetical protein CROQUDRAFT_77876 [Cronartium quercuum f. sp. fusiforme G11]|uniref:Arrestin-like N-terminal domain-containing protein n=1 Tax=Cronartium quercuum f. sp. fusiforme G11 TaxID=708437 RepID=A0A9P6NL99_9BASI|nr:hypothetical protein CROQUDRAFT_77876 [Cronartium quercuum f. sp. fusiforme G11]
MASFPSNTRSHSPPLPPNASYNHPSLSLTILPSANSFVAGSKLTGILEVCCRDQNKVALGQLAIEFLGVEELKLRDHSAQASLHGPHKCLFQGPSLPPSNAVAVTEAPIAGHYYTALRGRTKFPFSFPLPSKLPSSTSFEQLGAVRYTLKATCQVLSIKSQQNMLLTSTRLIRIIARRPDWSSSTLLHEPVEARAEIHGASGSGGGVWAELKTDKRLHWNSQPAPNPGFIHAALSVKNNSRRVLSGGVTVKLCRRLVVSQDPNPEDHPVQVVCTNTLRGPEYEFPATPGQAKTVDLTCPLPAITEPKNNNASSTDEAECFTARGMNLFSVQVFLRVELELGALSEDLVIELPLDIVHPASLPAQAHSKASSPTIEHVRSPDPLAVPSLTQAYRPRSGSNTSLRSTSPHPLSLQPGGGSRCASPQPDWSDRRSAAPSPDPSARFSPFPTPRQSPLPSSRFSSPFPYSTTPAYEPPSSTEPSLPYCLPTPNWSTPVTPYHSSGLQHQPPSQTQAAVPWPDMRSSSVPYPTYTEAGPSYPHQSIVSPPIVANLFSPPATPWCQRPEGLTQNLESVLSPPLTYPSPPTPSPSQPLARRHQSLPPTPALSFQSANSGIPFASSGGPRPRTEMGDAVTEANRRTSMPVVGQQVHLSESVRKRALPTPPVGGGGGGPLPAPRAWNPPQPNGWSALRPDDSQDGDHTMCEDVGAPQQGFWKSPVTHSEYRQPTPLGSRPAPDNNWGHQSLTYGHEIDLDQVSQGLINHVRSGPRVSFEDEIPERTVGVSQPARLETIGEAGESRIGTMDASQLPKGFLASLYDAGGGSRAVSHNYTRGMKPRRSDGSESVQTLEDIVAAQDHRREQTPDRLSDACPSSGREEEASNSQSEDASVPPTPVSMSLPPPSTQTKPRLTKSQSAGLAHLAGFLTRAHSNCSTMSEQPARTSNLSVASPDPTFERPITPSRTGTAGALRVKSSAIAFDHAFVDAVPPSSKLAKSVPASSGEGPTAQPKTSWVPPPPSAISSARLGGDDHTLSSLEKDDQQPTLTRQPAVAPAALFPAFDQRHRHQSLPNCAPPPSAPTPIVTTQTPLVVKKRSLRRNQSHLKRQNQSNPSEVVVASVEDEEKPKASDTHKLARWFMEGGSKEVHVSEALESASPVTQKTRWSALGIEMHDDEKQVPMQAKPESQPIDDISKAEQIPLVTSPPSSPISKPRFSQLASRLTPLNLQSSPVIISPSNTPDVKVPVALRPISQIMPRPEPVKAASEPEPIQSSSSPAPRVLPPMLSSIPRQSSSAIISPSNTPEVKVPVALRPVSGLTPQPDRTLGEGSDASTPSNRRPLPATPEPLQPAWALFSSRSPNLIPFPTSAEPKLLEMPSHGDKSPSCSPTTLSRKSRTKRQQAASCVSAMEAGRQEVEFAGGWEDPIHQSLIDAMKETNAAVAKATSKRLSTPVFSPSMSMHQIRSSPLRLSLSVSDFQLPKVENGEIDVEETVEEEGGEVEAVDENVPIRLTDQEARSMRGGRGGRVSSVAAIWSSQQRKPSASVVSTRALSITERDHSGSKNDYKIKTEFGLKSSSVRTNECRTITSSESSQASSRSNSSVVPQTSRVGRLKDLIQRWEIK